MSRKIAREVAMKMAFAHLFGGEDTYEAVLEKSGITESPSKDDLAFTRSVVQGIEENAEEIDSLIRECAIGWSIERMPRVDLCILRLAIYEMKFRSDIPDSVSINEAVELAKQFGGDKSSAFINGMLGTLEKRITGVEVMPQSEAQEEPEADAATEAEPEAEAEAKAVTEAENRTEPVSDAEETETAAE